MSYPHVLPESPEAAEEQSKADAAFEAAGARYENNPDLAEEERKSAMKALCYGSYEASGEKANGASENTKDTSESALRKMQNAAEMDPDEFQEAIESNEENTKNAEKLFFSPEAMEAYLGEGKSENPTENKKTNSEWIEANLGADGPLGSSFERIKSNLVIPKRLEGKSMAEIFGENPADCFTLNEALSQAILYEIHTHLIHGQNVPEEALHMISLEIQDPCNNPLQKMQLFGDIFNAVHTAEGKGGQAQIKAFEAMIAKRKKKELDNTVPNPMTDSVANQKEENNKDTGENPDNKEPIGDVFGGGIKDILAGLGETTREA